MSQITQIPASMPHGARQSRTFTVTLEGLTEQQAALLPEADELRYGGASAILGATLMLRRGRADVFCGANVGGIYCVHGEWEHRDGVCGGCEIAGARLFAHEYLASQRCPEVDPVHPDNGDPVGCPTCHGSDTVPAAV